MHKVSIVATQMLESMIENPVATRAEVSDIANAVLDETMLSCYQPKQPSGAFPLQAVETMARVCEEAEKMTDSEMNVSFMNERFANTQQTIAMSALFSAYHMEAKAIVALTKTGSTARWMSRVISGVPIYAITDSNTALRSMALYRGVYPYFMKTTSDEVNQHAQEACDYLKLQRILEAGDTVITTMGERIAKVGSTNTLKVIKI